MLNHLSLKTNNYEPRSFAALRSAVLAAILEMLHRCNLSFLQEKFESSATITHYLLKLQLFYVI